MAIVIKMSAASPHHPSLRARRPSSASWTSPAALTAAGAPGAAGSVDRRPYQAPARYDTAQYPPAPQQDTHSMHGRGRSVSRAGSASSSSGSPSSRSSQLSDSPRVRLNGHSHLDHTAASGEEGLLLSVGGHGTGSGTMTTQRMRRPRRRADEVERLYKCIWNGCEKSYGTLSHLNDHVRLQRHGTKREPHEFKEARRIWRQERKSRRLREHAIQGPNASSHHHQRPHPLDSVPASASGSSFSTSTSTRVNTTIPANLQTSYRPNYARPPFFAADESSPEDAELDGDFDREHTPLTPPGLNTIGPRIAAATSSYHTYSRPLSSQNPTISSLPSYSLSAGARGFTNDHLDHQQDSYIHEHSQVLSPMQSAQAHQSTGPTQDPPKNGFRLPSIAELRLDLTLDEFEAHSALGSLSSAPVARPSSATASTEQHPSRGVRHRRRDSFESPNTSPNPSVPGVLSPPKFQSRPNSLAPPPPYHLYPNGHDATTNIIHSPDFTNQYRSRIPSAASSPSMERPPSRSLSTHAQSYQQQPQHVANNYSRPRALSHSRHPSSSRPSTSTTTSTSQSYHLSTPAHPPSNFPFISAQPPRTTPEASEGEPRRKRRKYEEIERRYQCGWNGCTKAYGTLNHLNDHVSLQAHGVKRRGSEFS